MDAKNYFSMQNAIGVLGVCSNSFLPYKSYYGGANITERLAKGPLGLSCWHYRVRAASKTSEVQMNHQNSVMREMHLI